MRPFSRSLIESLQGAGVLAVLLALFFSTPLARLREVHFSCADLFQDYSLTRVEAGHVAGNKLPGDTVTQMQPWAMFNRDELAAGRVPLWNPWNGAGCPHLANYQSAVFSPFSAPFYAFDFKLALVASAFLKLFGLGFLTLLFLRELGLSRIAALLGAVAFAFAGVNVFWLGYPHVGVLIGLPGGLLFAEKALRRFEAVAFWGPEERRARARVGAPLAGMTLSLTASLLAGHPEPAVFVVLLVAAWIAARLLGIAVSLRRTGKPLRPLVLLSAGFVLAGVIAAGLAAVQLLPFLEYLEHSNVLARRSQLAPLDAHFWPLLFFPAALGDPSTSAHLSLSVPAPNFAEVNVVYVGSAVLFLTLLASAFVRGDRRVRFFLLAAIVWLAYAYDLLGTAGIIGRIPGLGLAPMNRSQGVWAFCTACAAALTLDNLLRRETKPAWGKATLTALAGLAALAIFRLGAQGLIDEYASFSSLQREAYEELLPRHLRWMALAFAAGIVAVCLLWIARERTTRVIAGSAVVLVAFLQTGWSFKDYNPVCEDRFFHPATPAIGAIRRAVGGERVAILGEDGLPPDSNVAHGIALIQSNDALWVRDFDSLYRERFGSSYAWRPIIEGSEKDLLTFGVPWVLAKWNWVFLDAGKSWKGPLLDQSLDPVEVTAEREVTQTFVCDRDRFQEVTVFAGVGPGTKPCTLRFRLVETSSGKVVCERGITSREVEADIYTNRHVRFRLDPVLVPAGRPVVFSFDPQTGSEGRKYSLTLSCADGVAGDTVTTWVKRDGELLFAWSCTRDSFDFVEQIGDYGLYRLSRSLGRYWTVPHSATATDGPDAIELLRAPSFDPARVVVIGPDDEGDWRRARRRVIRGDGSSPTYLVSLDGRSAVRIEDELRLVSQHFDPWEVEQVSSEELGRFDVVTPDRELERRLGARVADILPTGSRPPKVVAETPTWIRLEVQCDAPETLVIAQAHYPGWRGRVNGVEKPVLRANYAFSAIELQRGLNVVDFSYEPQSFRIGLWTGLASLLAGLLCLFHRPAGSIDRVG